MDKTQKADEQPETISIGVNIVERRHCNSRCYFAKSKDCSCICGGQNHGIEVELDSQDEPAQQSIFTRSMTKDEFYKSKKRQRSRELDFRVWWRDGRNFPVYRVTWVADTGELYAIDQHDERLEILAIITDEAELEKTLDGWAGVCGLMNSLQWVRNRVA